MTPPASGTTRVRRVERDEPLESVAAIQAASFDRPWGLDALRRELRDNPSARLYLLEQGADLVGFCACWLVLDELHINSLAIAPASRRQGLARRLLAGVFDAAVAEGARVATLEVRRTNVPALALYGRFGFRVEGVRRGYYEQPTEDALVLWHRSLAAGDREW